MTLIELIQQHIYLTPEKEALFSAKIKQEKPLKGTILLQEGEICRKVYFVNKGCLRFFYYDEAGKDITHWFLFEGDFITEIDSHFKQKPSEFYIECLEDCTLETFTIFEMQSFFIEYPSISAFFNIIMIDIIINLGEKIKDLQFRDATTRYNNLIQKHADILLRVPLGHIASYLGITQQSLSRIRRKK